LEKPLLLIELGQQEVALIDIRTEAFDFCIQCLGIRCAVGILQLHHLGLQMVVALLQRLRRLLHAGQCPACMGEYDDHQQQHSACDLRQCCGRKHFFLFSEYRLKKIYLLMHVSNFKLFI
jgi:hypothetical protein